jgi:hypothetical protein
VAARDLRDVQSLILVKGRTRLGEKRSNPWRSLALKRVTVPAGTPSGASIEASAVLGSRGPEDTPATFVRASTNADNGPLGFADLDHLARLAPLRNGDRRGDSKMERLGHGQASV